MLRRPTPWTRNPPQWEGTGFSRLNKMVQEKKKREGGKRNQQADSNGVSMMTLTCAQNTSPAETTAPPSNPSLALNSPPVDRGICLDTMEPNQRPQTVPSGETDPASDCIVLYHHKPQKKKGHHFPLDTA
ncbi:Hypothetical predicted protein [Marmota monax]|uniref:Uncharacterized protein n=1 Tax=Marmota monax TaxID=9995 RepID=A0A5E4A756_MARMO|nr:hypothetical protein GHT09_006449 [Marmota monax]VTJ52954.1 Hypothetical predicted protein [Marmota monax]